MGVLATPRWRLLALNHCDGRAAPGSSLKPTANAMEAGEVQAWPWHQGSQPLHEFQRRHHEVGGAVARRVLSLSTSGSPALVLPRQLEAKGCSQGEIGRTDACDFLCERCVSKRCRGLYERLRVQQVFKVFAPHPRALARRGPRRRPSLQPQVHEDPLDHRQFEDGRDDLELLTAARTVFEVDLEALAEQSDYAETPHSRP